MTKEEQQRQIAELTVYIEQLREDEKAIKHELAPVRSRRRGQRTRSRARTGMRTTKMRKPAGDIVGFLAFVVRSRWFNPTASNPCGRSATG